MQIRHGSDRTLRTLDLDADDPPRTELERLARRLAAVEAERDAWMELALSREHREETTA